MLTIPMIDWVAKARLEPEQAGQLLDREVRAADRQRLAMVAGRGQWHADQTASTSPATIPTTPTCRRRSLFQQAWVQHLGRHAGAPNAKRRPALLHPRQRAEPLALHASRRPPDGPTMDEIRDKMIDYAGRSRRSIHRRWSSDRRSGAGAGICSAATISNTAARTAGASCPTASSHGGTDYLPWLLERSSVSTTWRTASACSTSSPCTTIRRAASSATMSSTAMQLRRNRSTRSLWDPELRGRNVDQRPGPADPALEELGRHLLPRHADRHHRIQLGRGEPHQRRDDAGRHLRHLRTRRAGHGGPLDHARRRARRPTKR